jgi:hypothetical protein
MSLHTWLRARWDDRPWLNDVLWFVGRSLAVALMLLGWPLFLHALADVAYEKHGAEVRWEAYKACATRGIERVERVEGAYQAWLRSLAPLHHRTPPARMVPARATEDGGN